MTFRIKIPVDDPVWAHFFIWTKGQDHKITDLRRIIIRVILPDLLFCVRGIHKMVLHAGSPPCTYGRQVVFKGIE
jgi:hypothetical protein